MTGYYIKTIRDFSRLLFLEDHFDAYLLIRARFVTDFTTDFDGTLTDGTAAGYNPWGKIKSSAFQLIKGSVPPKSFSVMLALPVEKTRALLQEAADTGAGEESPLLLLNIRYQQEKLLITTGLSEKSFQPGSPIGPLWDRQLLPLLEGLGLSQAIAEL